MKIPPLAIVGVGLLVFLYLRRRTFTETLNPASDKNIAYQTVNRALGFDPEQETIGTRAYDYWQEIRKRVTGQPTDADLLR